jgi:hypothetical protein
VYCQTGIAARENRSSHPITASKILQPFGAIEHKSARFAGQNIVISVRDTQFFVF